MLAAAARTCTHLGNALPNELSRHNNIIWTALANPNYTPMFISDGFHLPKEMLHCYVRAAPLDRLITVSDCSYPGGLPPGTYEKADASRFSRRAAGCGARGRTRWPDRRA